LFVIRLWYSKWLRSTFDFWLRGFCLKSNPLINSLADGGPFEIDLDGLGSGGVPVGSTFHDLPDALIIVTANDVVLVRKRAGEL